MNDRKKRKKKFNVKVISKPFTIYHVRIVAQKLGLRRTLFKTLLLDKPTPTSMVAQNLPKVVVSNMSMYCTWHRSRFVQASNWHCWKLNSSKNSMDCFVNIRWIPPYFIIYSDLIPSAPEFSMQVHI